MNYIIFGGSGFIGTHLIHLLKDECLKPGDKIYDLDIVMPGEEGVVPGIVEKNEGVEYIRLDVRQAIEFDFEPTKDDIIFNLAAVHRTPGHPDHAYFETNIRGAENRENLYTVDLICHGSPSPRILERFLNENRIDIAAIKDLKFRNKTAFGLESGYKRISFDNQQDLYTFAFLTSLDYTENCYSCRYASLERVSDITLGDSWGSELSDMEQKKGISLILCQSPKGVELVRAAGFEIRDVDLEKAVAANHQLRHPSEMPEKRDLFFENIDKGFYRAIAKCYPKMYYKRRLKSVLNTLKSFGGGRMQ